MMLRDRDAILTAEAIILRVYGYSHPYNGYVCDVEYAPSDIFRSSNPRAIRQGGTQTFYKFYADEGLNFVIKNYPQYTIFYEPLQKSLVGVLEDKIKTIQKPEVKLQDLLHGPATDDLLGALHKLVDLITCRSSLTSRSFGVFGSLLHDFYHPKFSDLDLIIYGKKDLLRLNEVLEEYYGEADSPLQKEFDGQESSTPKRWRFRNYSFKEFLWHQNRKKIYAVYKSRNRYGRNIKVEFEPVKGWNELRNEYAPQTRIIHRGWIKALARVTNDSDAPFLPSIYPVELLKVFNRPKIVDVHRIISYVEEFRMQAKKDELIYVEGNLEQVTAPKRSFDQIILTYGPRYYEQVLKTIT